MNIKEMTPTQKYNLARKVIKLRTKDLLSWATIGDMVGLSARQARKLFQSRVGEHQHHDHIPGKGGRFPNEWDTAAEQPYLAGDGNVNEWQRVYGSDLARCA